MFKYRWSIAETNIPKLNNVHAI